MKAGKLHSHWIVLKGALATADISLRALIMSVRGKIDRRWTDSTIQNWSEHLLNEIGVTLTVLNAHNTEITPGVPHIIMCNHNSIYDIPISFKAFPKSSVRMLAKKELSHIPLLNKAMKSAEFPFVDRKNRQQAIKDMHYATELMKSGIVLWIAPEGTRSTTGKLRPFKKGGFITAIQTQARIIPIAIQGAHDILPAQEKHIKLNQEASIHVGQAIDAATYSLDDKEQLIQRVRIEMKKLCGEN